MIFHALCVCLPYKEFYPVHAGKEQSGWEYQRTGKQVSPKVFAPERNVAGSSNYYNSLILD
jgi:hypothetical protein